MLQVASARVLTGSPDLCRMRAATTPGVTFWAHDRGAEKLRGLAFRGEVRNASSKDDQAHQGAAHDVGQEGRGYPGEERQDGERQAHQGDDEEDKRRAVVTSTNLTT
jgi:hypothetical protein